MNRIYVVYERFKMPPTNPTIVAAFGKYTEATQYCSDMNKTSLNRVYNVEERIEGNVDAIEFC